MSMFRSPTDISSSDPDSSSEESDNDDLASTNNADTFGTPDKEEIPSMNLEELLLEGPGPPENGGVLGGALDLDADGHAAVMTSALLEFFCLSRAEDWLNAQPGSFNRFTRGSPEVKQLAKKMYQYKSQFLSSHGIVAGGIDDDDWERIRQYYRDNLDVLGNTAVEGVNTVPSERRPRSKKQENEIKKPSSTVKTLVPTLKHRPAVVSRTPSQENIWNLQKRYPAYDNHHTHSEGFVQFTNLLRAPQHSSEPFAMMSTRAGPISDRLSRYTSEFIEVKLLGRGSFGQVFEARHHMDGQSYAIKKIPLSKRRLEMLQQEGVQHLEHILKEIRTLARLEHKNVVRYFGAWVEENHVYMASPPSLDSEPEIKSRIESVQEDPAEEDQSFGIVFGLSSNGGEDDLTSNLPSQEANPWSNSRRYRRDSHFTSGSSLSKKSVTTSNEDDDDVESIQRNFSVPEPGASQGHSSTWDKTDTDIFTNDMSEDPSKLQLMRRDDPQNQSIILHIQMSLHPLTLSSYLSPRQVLRSDMQAYTAPRHCFHIIPSLKLMLGILSGVEYLHSKGIVHRDLKPANIFLSVRENEKDACDLCKLKNEIVGNMYRPRIGDFGLVADVSHCTDPQVPHVTTVQDSPRRLRQVGTEFYCPRKSQFDSTHTSTGYVIDEKLDVFALGVILFELTYRLNTKMERQLVLSELTHHGAHDGVKIPSDFVAKVDRGGIRLSNNRSVGEYLSSCIQGMLHPDPQRRLGCRDIRKALLELVTMIETACSA
ncbi:kinase-like domain-containing protein [Talaromyces proteolyticus]|uniref:Kinase-like domain-containing protein n=1 Tax=Talaromyces proteolyticus TaxID=1131652 RepID=A0AAD4KPZ6_9EURO|nr:kinase-like domain-containing protein [Talaromyces proteolyticus]KAH8696714.1 kinase-like domain-containing protein [Talaromyces proteolyticus]